MRTLQRLLRASAAAQVPRALALAWVLFAIGGLALAEGGPPGPVPAPAGEETPGPAPGTAQPNVEIPGTRLANPQDYVREAMWVAPTAEDWERPVQIHFERSWDDAVAVAKETGKPILVCINMDGEIASEHFAGIRYRSPEVAALYEPYVCVIASVYRHNPRDYDSEGHRILCPRFGSVTCGEHIAIEPTIFEKFCDGQRIAPRHIAVDLNGNETFDVYYLNDTYSIFKTIYDGLAKFPPAKPSIVRGDRPIVERVQSRAAEDRVAVEGAYAAGDPALRKQLLEAALNHGETAQLDLLRLAIFGLDPELSRVARQALTKIDSPLATRLVADALRVPMEQSEREALIATLKRLGETSKLAQWLGVIHQGLASRSEAVDVTNWEAPKAGNTYPAPQPLVTLEGTDLGSLVEMKARASQQEPSDSKKQLELAEATLALALESPRIHATDPAMARLLGRHLYEDAYRAARDARDLGATGWRADSALALTAYYAGDVEPAYEYAAAAVKEIPPGDMTWYSMAVLTIFAEGRFKAIKAAAKEKRDWPSEWLADLHAAYAALLRHPLGTDGQVAWHYDLLDWIGADDQAQTVLEQGLERFYDSSTLHTLMRKRLLRLGGPEALEATYEKMLADDDARPIVAIYAGIASTQAAEQYRRMRKYAEAQEAYGRAIATYVGAWQKGNAMQEASAHLLALAHAGRARVALVLQNDEEALANTLASFEADPSAAGTRDGMGITPVETAQMLLERLRSTNRQDLAQKLEEALSGLDPEFLLPDRN